MRLIRVISFIVTLLILSAGCNDDVFIEKLVVSQTDFLVPSLGGEIELVMNHPDWMIGRVAVNHVDCEGVVVDEKGKEHYSSLIYAELHVEQKICHFAAIRICQSYFPRSI